MRGARAGATRLPECPPSQGPAPWAVKARGGTSGTALWRSPRAWLHAPLPQPRTHRHGQGSAAQPPWPAQPKAATLLHLVPPPPDRRTPRGSRRSGGSGSRGSARWTVLRAGVKPVTRSSPPASAATGPRLLAEVMAVGTASHQPVLWRTLQGQVLAQPTRPRRRPGGSLARQAGSSGPRGWASSTALRRVARAASWIAPLTSAAVHPRLPVAARVLAGASRRQAPWKTPQSQGLEAGAGVARAAQGS
mmetsp:Transcript_20123/g.60669  ORF Transcript_20123/g.60669 Transcript_20123/m.60669 type:complete len:248 (-) Transcript_20123:65-808(-)